MGLYLEVRTGAQWCQNSQRVLSKFTYMNETLLTPAICVAVMNVRKIPQMTQTHTLIVTHIHGVIGM